MSESNGMDRPVRAQFKDAAHELAFGLTPPIMLGAGATIATLSITSPYVGGYPMTAPALSSFVGAVVMVVSLRFWLRHLMGGKQ